MRKFLTALLLLTQIFLFAQVNPNYHRVNGYYRKDGTYVRGHYRTNPNSTNRDNYSTLGNTNPHTGKPGWIRPDNKPLPTYSNSNSYSPQSNYRSLDNYSSIEAGERIVHYANGMEVFNLSGKTKTDFQQSLNYYYYDPSIEMVVDAEGAASGYLLEGAYKFYDEKGTLKVSESYSNGLKHGTSIHYNDDGSKSYEERYVYGRLEAIEIPSSDGNRMVWDDSPAKVGAIRKTYNRSNRLIEKLIVLPNDLLEVSAYNEQNGNLEGVYRIKDDVFDGPYTEYYEDGKTKKESGIYLNGEKTGLVTFYDEKGNPYLELSYEKGNQDGPYIFRGEKFVVRGFIKNGELEGKASKYDLQDELIGIEHFRNGQRHGDYSEIKDGKAVVKGKFNQEKKQGLWEYFYQGESREDYYRYQYLTYQNDILQGPFQLLSGDSLVVGSFQQGKRHGKIDIYHPLLTMLTGRPAQTSNPDEIWASGYYFQGKKHGDWKHYDFNRNLVAEGRFEHGKKEGVWKYFYPVYFDNGGGKNPHSGELFSTFNYKNGRKHGKTVRLSQILKIPVNCSQNEKLDTCYRYQIEKIQSTSFYKNGLLEGPYELLDSLGNLIRKGIYENGKRDGIWIENTDEGRIEASFKSGIHSGGFRIYNLQGDLIRSGMMSNGQPTGNWYEYYPGGQQKLKQKITHHGFGKSREAFRLDQTRFFLSTFQDSTVGRITLYNESGHEIRKTYEVEWVDHDKIGLMITSFSQDKVCSEQQIIFTDYPEISKSPEALLAQLGENPEMNKLENTRIVRNGNYEIRDAKIDQLIVKGEYEQGQKFGVWQRVLGDQGVRQEITYGKNELVEQEIYRDQRTGKPISRKITLTNPDGGYELIALRKGIRHGRTIVFDQLSKTVETRKYRLGVLIK